ncbi:MAG: S8 family serine peptidase [Streptosporangiaceae bacterium]
MSAVPGGWRALLIRNGVLPCPRRPAPRRTARRTARPEGPAQPWGAGPAARGKRLIRLAALTAALALPAAGIAAASAPAGTAPSATRIRHLGAATTITSAAAFRTAAGATAPIPAVAGEPVIRLGSPDPLSTAQCLSAVKLRCYSPVQYRVAYDLGPLYSAGITGKDRTIVIVDSFGSPTIGHDLQVFDKQWGLPNPTLDTLVYPKLPKFRPGDATMDGWAEETTLDVEYAHAIAPGAKILLVQTPTAETEGVAGFPDMMKAEQWVIDHNLGDVISQSFGATEDTFPGFGNSNDSLRGLRYAFANAARQHVTVLAASGDSGATNDEADGATLYPYRAVSWPSSDPLVTSVGGTQLLLAQDGNRIQPDRVWDDTYGASGGGVSSVFARPSYQDGVTAVVGNWRGTPDISMPAAVTGGCWVYESFEPSGAGWEILGGTSEATPIFAGIVALADQVAGHRLGNINPALYTLGGLSQVSSDASRTGIVDVTSGSNSYGRVAGYTATPGYDLASGWGTIDAARFVPALARVGG